MCAGYGLEALGPNSRRSERAGRLGPIPPGGTPDGDALLALWQHDQGGRARITGRHARNLNPLIRVRGGERELALAWWWLHVRGEPAEFTAFNSRADRLLASWGEPFQQRGLVPASWYVEKGVRFALPDGEDFGMAVVTAPVGASSPGVPGAAGAELDSYSVVTRGAVAHAAEVHDRMPLVLPRELHDEWLDPERPGDADLVRRALAASEEISASIVALGSDVARVRGLGRSTTSGQSERGAERRTAGDEHPRLF